MKIKCLYIHMVYVFKGLTTVNENHILITEGSHMKHVLGHRQSLNLSILFLLPLYLHKNGDNINVFT
jgi:hypothetical protein